MNDVSGGNFGIRYASTSGIVVVGNVIRNTTPLPSVNDAGSNTNAVVRRNIGWTTENFGIFTGSGNGSTTVYSFSHGLNVVPNSVNIDATSPQARANFDVSGGTNLITVTYPMAPGSGNLKLMWGAQA